MRIIALSTLKVFWEDSPKYSDAIDPTLAWYRHTLQADWATPTDVKQDFRNASILKDGRVVFNIAGCQWPAINTGWWSGLTIPTEWFISAF